MSRYGVPDDEMGAGFPFGHRGFGSQGDPDPGTLLPEAIAEAILDGRPLDGRVLRGPLSAEIRPLVEAVGALRAEPMAAELRGHAQAMAAFREVSGPGEITGLAHTRQLEVPHHHMGRRVRRARHRAPGRTAPAGRPSAKHLTLATVGAAALVMVLSLVAYSGYLPGPLQRGVHVPTGGSAATRPSSAPPSHPVAGPGGLAGSSATPAASPTPSATPAPSATPSASDQTRARLCQAYFSDPLRDMGDFQKLSKAAGGPMKVLKYCQPYLRDEQFRWPPGLGGQGPDHGNGSNSNTGNGSVGNGSVGNTGNGSVGGSTATNGSGQGGTGTTSPQHAR